MEKIKLNLALESEAGLLYKRYCEENNIECRITAAANFCLGYMVVKQNQGATWVKAAKRLPDSWHLKCARFIHTKIPLLDPGAWVKDNQEHIGDVEWLDESPAVKEEGKLTQYRADLIREANNRDLGGTAAAREEDWISVDDRLPYRDGDSSVYCIVYDVYWGVVVRPYNEAHNCWDGEDGDDYYTDAKGGKITHWKPIPESPFKQQKQK